MTSSLMSHTNNAGLLRLLWRRVLERVNHQVQMISGIMIEDTWGEIVRELYSSFNGPRMWKDMALSTPDESLTTFLDELKAQNEDYRSQVEFAKALTALKQVKDGVDLNELPAIQEIASQTRKEQQGQSTAQTETTWMKERTNPTKRCDCGESVCTCLAKALYLMYVDSSLPGSDTLISQSAEYGIYTASPSISVNVAQVKPDIMSTSFPLEDSTNVTLQSILANAHQTAHTESSNQSDQFVIGLDGIHSSHPATSATLRTTYHTTNAAHSSFAHYQYPYY